MWQMKNLMNSNDNSILTCICTRITLLRSKLKFSSFILVYTYILLKKLRGYNMYGTHRIGQCVPGFVLKRVE